MTVIVFDRPGAAVADAREDRPARPAAEPRPATDPALARDRRYGSARWRRVSKAVLRRDLYVCRIAPGCSTRATVADHVIAVHPGMPDALFFGMDNLRAGCRDHNILRGKAARLERETAGVERPAALVTGDYT